MSEMDLDAAEDMYDPTALADGNGEENMSDMTADEIYAIKALDDENEKVFADLVSEMYDKFLFRPPQRKMDNYSILGEEDIRHRQEEAIARFCSILFVSKEEALTVLLHMEWNVERVIEEWLSKEEEIRREFGLWETRSRRNSSAMEIDLNLEMECAICCDTYFINGGMNAGVCGHYYCNGCWLHWIQACIDELGPGCLLLKCPELSCRCAISQDLVIFLLTHADEKYQRKYTKYIVRSYVENNRISKWCPAPGCEYAVELLCGNGPYDVTCKCSHNFCWKCLEEGHSPVDCETAKKWGLKNNVNSEILSENWKAANTKPCPKCKLAIEKNGGCMHMICGTRCGFHFCWRCLSDWKNHSACQVQQTNNGVQQTNSIVLEPDGLKTDFERYANYYKLWAANEYAKAKALSDLQHFRTVEGNSNLDLEPVTDAWLQIIECRDRLKWTYVYGYYLPLNGDANTKAKKDLFEHMQAYAESSLNRLHQSVKDAQAFIQFDRSMQEFDDFCARLKFLTSATCNYFENFFQALEEGLTDVNAT